MAWYEEHKEWIDSSPEAGAWFLPLDDEDDKFDLYSYTQQFSHGLRKRRTPEEYLRAVKYRGAADEYFRVREQYDQARANAGDDQAEKNRVDDIWQRWSTTYRASNPIFAEELVSGAARERRYRTIEQLRYAVDDPLAPASPHMEAIRQMTKSWDEYEARMTLLAPRRDAQATEMKRQVREAFRNWVTQWTLKYPHLERLWKSVYEPEANLD